MKLTTICSVESSTPETPEHTPTNTENAADSETEDRRVEEPGQ
jgi:hypothetical protein